MKTQNIIEGLVTLMPFYDNQNGFHTGADHDTIYAYATDRPLSDAVVDRMIELGWFQENFTGMQSREFEKQDYDKDELWVCYV